MGAGSDRPVLDLIKMSGKWFPASGQLTPRVVSSGRLLLSIFAGAHTVVRRAERKNKKEKLKLLWKHFTSWRIRALDRVAAPTLFHFLFCFFSFSFHSVRVRCHAVRGRSFRCTAPEMIKIAQIVLILKALIT